MRSPALLALALALPAALHAALHEIWWNITYTTANPDGLFARRVIGVNGSWPPPPVEVASTDTLRVHARNGLDVPTSLHHHGMFFNASAWADGAVGVTQCGIPPGAVFTYDVAVQDWNQWGTYWIHAHYQGQFVDGLRTPFVVHNAAGEVHAAKYDDEYTVVLGDWYHAEYAGLADTFLSIKNPGGAEPVPDSALIYFTHGGAYLPPTRASGLAGPVGFNENATLPFAPGKTYRLRIVNTSGFAMIFFWIDGHDMRVVEVDGTDTEEYATALLAVTVAQRYSVLVTARNDTAQNFVVHANMDTDMFDTVPDGLNPNITSSVTYAADAPLADAVDAPAYFDVDDTALVPVVVEPQLPPPDHIVDLNVFFDTFDNGGNRAAFNNITYNTPRVPSLLSELSLGGDAVVPAAYGPNAFVLQHNEIVEIRVHNWDAGKHPFHLHGHKFQIVHKSTDVTSADPALNPPPVAAGQANPVRRDTVQVPTMGNAFLRLRADNPGTWFFHCHIEWHLSAGLAVTFLEAPLAAQQSVRPPAFVAAQCAAQGLPAAGNAAGHAGAADLSGLALGPYPQNNGWHARGAGAMAGCVLSAALGMLAVAWYAFGGAVSDAEMEAEAREAHARKVARGGVVRKIRGVVRR